jgi:hypothetical protein
MGEDATNGLSKLDTEQYLEAVIRGLGVGGGGTNPRTYKTVLQQI